MSHDHDAGEGAHADEEEHGHPAFDGEPATELAPDEPRTPGWVPALGASLLVLAGIYLLASRTSTEPSIEPGAPASAEAASPTPTVHQLTLPELAQPLPTAAPGASVPQLTPEQLEALKKRLEQQRALHPPQPGAPRPPSNAPAPAKPPPKAGH